MKMTEARVEMNFRAAEALKSVLSEVSTLKLKEIRRASAVSGRQDRIRGPCRCPRPLPYIGLRSQDRRAPRQSSRDAQGITRKRRSYCRRCDAGSHSDLSFARGAGALQREPCRLPRPRRQRSHRHWGSLHWQTHVRASQLRSAAFPCHAGERRAAQRMHLPGFRGCLNRSLIESLPRATDFPVLCTFLAPFLS